MKEIDIYEYDLIHLNDNGIELVIENDRYEFREEFFELMEEWDEYDD